MFEAQPNEMNNSIEYIKKIFDDYHRFDDGLILSFGHVRKPSEKLSAEMVFHAKNQSLKGNVWRNVKVAVKDVKEFHAHVMGNESYSICSGVKLLKFGDMWCIDIDGVYDNNMDPQTMDDIRRLGRCYVTGHTVEVYELDD
jgi:hypothetical protein